MYQAESQGKINFNEYFPVKRKQLIFYPAFKDTIYYYYFCL